MVEFLVRRERKLDVKADVAVRRLERLERTLPAGRRGVRSHPPGRPRRQAGERTEMGQEDANSQWRRSWDKVLERAALSPCLTSAHCAETSDWTSSSPHWSPQWRQPPPQDLTFEVGLDGFAGLTHQKFTPMHTSLKPARLLSRWSCMATHEHNGDSSSSSVDWTTQRVVTFVKNQG